MFFVSPKAVTSRSPIIAARRQARSRSPTDDTSTSFLPQPTNARWQDCASFFDQGGGQTIRAHQTGLRRQVAFRCQEPSYLPLRQQGHDDLAQKFSPARRPRLRNPSIKRSHVVVGQESA
jgi:hypothetical protein